MKNNRHFLWALAMGFTFTFACSLWGVSAYSDTMQKNVANEVIRFHVKANSDSESDQQLKIFVKDMVLEHFREGLSAAENIGETRAFLSANLGEIEDYAKDLVHDKGYDYNVTAKLTTDYFPTKRYGDVTLPAGNYEALRIDIGAAAGQNWWCVMFPPLCFVDVSVKEIPEKEKQQLKNILTDEEYRLVTSEEKDIKVKFKLVEVWQEMKSGRELYARK